MRPHMNAHMHLLEIYVNKLIGHLEWTVYVSHTFKLPFVVNAFWQTLQTNGRSPVWVRKWIWTAELELKFFRQIRHRCFEFADWGFSFDCLFDIGNSSKYDDLVDCVGEEDGYDVGKLFSNDFLEWNRELGMGSGKGIVDFSCNEPVSLNYVKTFKL